VKRHRTTVAVAVLCGLAIVSGTLAASLGGGSRPPARHQVAAATPVTPSLGRVGWRAVAPATTVPAQTPVQQLYDQAFEQGFGSPANEALMARAEALALPDPAISGGWPVLGPSDTPEGWAIEFVQALWNIDFARRSRRGLGAWLVAQEAPDLMPGIPAAFAGRALYVSVMDPAIMGQSPLIPSATQWQADAAAGVRWSVSDLEITLDPQWQSMIAAGWQPTDLHAAVEDVSGVLSITRRASTATHRFSVALQLGSARWHRGYGTVTVAMREG
jgi:hypothetical protein